MTPGDLRRRLAQLMVLVSREDRHLRAVRDRLFDGATTIDAEWVRRLTADPTGVDRLESFGAKFGRMQDTVMDKLLPTLLRASGEVPGTAVDNLNRAARLGWLDDPDAWIAMRLLRDRLVHDYMIDPEEMAAALRSARAFTDTLHTTWSRMEAYAREHLGLRKGLDG